MHIQTLAREGGISDFEIKQLQELLAELSPDRRFPGRGELTTLFNLGTRIFVARDTTKQCELTVGMATLCPIRKLGSREATVEDVVVRAQYQGQGIGRQLMDEVIAYARANSIVALHLTSRAERAAANALYRKMGFAQRETNVYMLKL